MGSQTEYHKKYRKCKVFLNSVDVAWLIKRKADIDKRSCSAVNLEKILFANECAEIPRSSDDNSSLVYYFLLLTELHLKIKKLNFISFLRNFTLEKRFFSQVFES